MVQNTRQNIYTFLGISLFLHAALFVNLVNTENPFKFKFAANKDQALIVQMKIQPTKVETIKSKKKQVEKKSKNIIKKVSKNTIKKKPVDKVLKAQPAKIKGEVGKKVLNAYVVELKNYLEKHKRYPRIAAKLRQSGIVKVKLSILQDGTFKDIKVLDPSQYKSLNKSALNLLKELGSFKPLPKEFYPKEEFIIPIKYVLSRSR